MAPGFGEDAHRAPQRQLGMRRLQSAVRKVSSELEASGDLVWRLRDDPPSLHLHRQTDDVLAARLDQLLDLVRLLRSRRHDKEQLLQDGAVRREGLDELSAREEARGFGELGGFQVLEIEGDGRQDFAQLGRFWIAADVEGQGWERRVGRNRDMCGLVRVQEEGFQRGEADSGNLAIEQLQSASNLIILYTAITPDSPALPTQSCPQPHDPLPMASSAPTCRPPPLQQKRPQTDPPRRHHQTQQRLLPLPERR